MSKASSNTAQVVQPSEPSIPARPASQPQPAITIGYAGVRRSWQSSAGENRQKTNSAAKLIPLRVRSTTVSGKFIPLAGRYDSLAGYTVVGVTMRPAKSADIDLPSVNSRLEFSYERVQAFGVVHIRGEQLSLMLLDDEEEASLPDNVELVGVVTAPVGTHVLNVYDPLLDERYPLGYQLGVVFPNTTQPNWAELALKHREKIEAELAAERSEQQAEDRAEAERLADAEREKLELAEILVMPKPQFVTSDKEVLHRLHETYANAYRPVFSREGRLPDSSATFSIDDPDKLGPAIAQQVERERAQFGDGADRQFERMRELRS